MIDQSLPIRFNGRVGETIQLKAYLRLTNGSVATPTNVASMTVKVTKSGVQTVADTPSVATCILTPVVTNDPSFDDDTNDDRTERGYNLKWTATAAAFPTTGWYTVRFTFTGTDGSVTLKVFEGAVRGTI